MPNYSKFLICISLFFSQKVLAQDCNSGVDKTTFVQQAVEDIHDLTGLLNESDLGGLTSAIETYYDFSLNLSEDSKMCLEKFHIFSHRMPITMSPPNVFTRAPHVMISGQGMGFDLSFIEEGESQPANFISAVIGALDFLEVKFGDGVSLGEAFSEINRTTLAYEMAETSFQICATSALRCYNQAMYRLVTLPLSNDPATYLNEKGYTQDFANLICQFEDYSLVTKLIETAKPYYEQIFSDKAIDYFDENKVACSSIAEAIQEY